MSYKCSAAGTCGKNCRHKEPYIDNEWDRVYCIYEKHDSYKTAYPLDVLYKQKETKMEEKLLTFKEVCECVARGENLQCKLRGSGHGWEKYEWMNSIEGSTTRPVIDLYNYNYRRKPTATVVPWDRTTYPGVGSVICNSNGDECLIVGVTNKMVSIGIYGHQSWEVLLKNGFTYNDKPCGVEVIK